MIMRLHMVQKRTLKCSLKPMTQITTTDNKIKLNQNSEKLTSQEETLGTSPSAPKYHKTCNLATPGGWGVGYKVNKA